MIALGLQLSTRCWCGISTTDAPCLYHGGDLAERVERLLRDIAIKHDDPDAMLTDAAKWLAFVVTAGRPGRALLGDVTFSYAPTFDPQFTDEERDALTGDALAERWPL